MYTHTTRVCVTTKVHIKFEFIEMWSGHKIYKWYRCIGIHFLHICVMSNIVYWYNIIKLDDLNLITFS